MTSNLNNIEEKVSRIFKTPAGIPYVQVKFEGQIYNYPADSSEFAEFIGMVTFLEDGDLPDPNKINRLQAMFVAKARFGNEVEEVHLRTARISGGMEIDLNDGSNKVVKVTAEGWKIEQASVLFYRPKTMKPLPIPERYDDWHIFKNHMVTSNLEDLKVIISFMLACFKPEGPYSRVQS